MGQQQEKLTDKEERFCREYLTDLHKAKAAARAGFSPRSGHVTASRLLKKAKIQRRLAELQAEIAAKVEITTEKVLRDLEQTRLAALRAEKFSAAARASELQGKHIGLFAERRENESFTQADFIKLLAGSDLGGDESV